MSLLSVADKPIRLLRWRSLSIDLDQAAIFVEGREVSTSDAEFGLLRTLLENRNRPMSKDGIMQALFGAAHGRDVRQADVYVARLRRALAPTGLDQLISAIPGRGYAIVDDEGQADCGRGYLDMEDVPLAA